jgi:hypothetical protein
MTNIHSNGDIARVRQLAGECYKSSPSSHITIVTFVIFNTTTTTTPLHSTTHSTMGNLRLGSTAPDFEAETTIGNIKVGTHPSPLVSPTNENQR